MDDLQAPWYVWAAELAVFLVLVVGLMAVVIVGSEALR